LANPQNKADALELLRRMQRRDDLLVRIGREIDELLEKHTSNPAPKAAPAPLVEAKPKAQTPPVRKVELPPLKEEKVYVAPPSPSKNIGELAKTPAPSPKTDLRLAGFESASFSPKILWMLASAVIWGVSLYIANDLDLNVLGDYGYGQQNLLTGIFYIVTPWLLQGYAFGFFAADTYGDTPWSPKNALFGGPLTILHLPNEERNLDARHLGIWAVAFALIMFVSYLLFMWLRGADALLYAGIFFGAALAYVFGVLVNATSLRSSYQ
jgi:hypothetical protein